MEVYPERDRSKQFLGKLCAHNHDWRDTGQSWRWVSSKACVECTYALWRKRHPAKKPHRFPHLPKTATTADKFWSKVEKTDGCWLWRGARDKKGYGHVNLGNGTWAATHRFSYELHCGRIPDGLWVLHRCDVPACVNPDHLFLGTVVDNNRDMRTKGRARIGCRPRGVDNNKAKLTDEVVQAMRELRVTGSSYGDLGRRFGVSKVAARNAVLGKTWKHVPL